MYIEAEFLDDEDLFDDEIWNLVDLDIDYWKEQKLKENQKCPTTNSQR